MIIKKFCLNAFLVVILFYSFNAINYADSTLQPGETKTIVESNNKFAFDFFKEISSVETEANFMVSPVSLSLALGMVYNGSHGSTKVAFENVLNYHGYRLGVNQFNKDLMAHLSSNVNGSTLEIANSIWAEKRFPVKENFYNVNKTYYSAEVKNLDFSLSSSADIINKWVSEKTNKKIPKIIDGIGAQEVMFLINAIYFNAIWKYKFDPDQTRSENFYKTSSKIVKAEMMKKIVNVPYLKNDLFSSIVLPYQSEKFSMVVLLPNKEQTIRDVLDSLTFKHWKAWLGSFKVKEVSVSLPKFKLDYQNKLNDELTNMGLGIAFSDRADFSGISDVPLKVSRVLQKTYIDVNESGTEAAAVTVVVTMTRSVRNRKRIFFNANKPFIYVIKDNKTGSICFIGKMGEPEYKK